jgi:hypothetical protein
MRLPYLKGPFEIVAGIADQYIPHMRADPFFRLYEKHAAQLIKCGVFTETHCLQTVIRRENQNLVYRKVICTASKCYYLSGGREVHVGLSTLFRTHSYAHF